MENDRYGYVLDSQGEPLFCEDCDVFVDENNLCEHYEVSPKGNELTENLELDMPADEKLSPSTLEEYLIEEVRKRPPLWNNQLPLKERFKGKKEKLWLEISKCFEGKMSIEALVSKWKNLKDTYNRKRQEEDSYTPSGSGATKRKRKWKYFDQMSFLSDSARPRSTKSNLGKPSMSSSISASLVGTSINGPDSSSKTNNKDNCSGASLVDESRTALLNAIEKMQEATPPPLHLPEPVNPICLRLDEILKSLPVRERYKLEIDLLTLAVQRHEEINC